MSTTPPPYDRQATFTSFHTEPAPTVGQDLEAEFNAIKQSQDATQSRLTEIQRDDGRLRNESVHPDALDDAVRALLGADAGVPRGNWQSGVVYNLKDLVTANGNTYLSAIEHLSGADFDVDLAAGKWLAIYQDFVESVSVTSTVASLESASTASSAVMLDHVTRHGLFKRVLAADHAALIAADTANLVVTPSTEDALYAWLRADAPDDATYLEARWALDSKTGDIGEAVNKCGLLGTAMGACGAIGTPGCTIQLPPGSWTWSMPVVPARSNTTLRGVKGSTRIVFPNTMAVSPAYRAVANPAAAVTGSYVYENVFVEDIIFDSRSRPFKYWLSKADGTTIANPEADYVMGTGALASGITGVNLTATIAGGRVTGVTINNGGAGWNGHPTYPYLPNLVRLRFEGGGAIKRTASAYATIVAGTLNSVTIEDGGLGYTVAPIVTSAGGYADIALLIDPTVDRRNALGYTQTNDMCMQFVQVDRGGVRGCKFLGGHRILECLGNRDFLIDDNEFVDCGKPDSVNFHVTMGDYINGADRTRADRNECRDSRVKGCKRAFAAMTCTGEQRLTNNNVNGGSLLQAGSGDAQTNNGRLIVAGNTNREVRYVNYGAQCGELIRTKNAHFLNNHFEDCDGQVFGVLGIKDCLFRGNTYRNIFRDVGTRRAGFTSESERLHEGTGLVPQVFKLVAEAKTPSMYTVANNGTDGMENVTFEDETVLDNRTTAGGFDVPAYLRWFRVGVGSDKIARNIRVRNIKMLRTATWQDNPDIALFHPATQTAFPDVMEPKMSLSVSDIADRNSGGVKLLSTVIAIAQAGDVTIDAGFPPKDIEIIVADAPGNGRISVARLMWTTETLIGARNLGASLTYNDTAGQQYYAGYNNRMFSIKDNAGTEVLAGTFKEWTQTGFIFTINVSTIGGTVQFLCRDR